MVEPLIDYSWWDFCGGGENLCQVLDINFGDIWNAALPYQDTRRGEIGHGEVVTFFGYHLEEILEADKDVVVTADILHDIGWSQLSPVERDLFYVQETDPISKGPIWKRYEPTLRARHQEQGVILAREILERLAYPSPEKREHVYEIISQHDTRKGFYSFEDELARSADMLWRYTLPCIDFAVMERKQSLQEVRENMEGWLDFFTNPKIREIAEAEIENGLQAYREPVLINRMRKEIALSTDR